MIALRRFGKTELLEPGALAPTTTSWVKKSRAVVNGVSCQTSATGVPTTMVIGCLKTGSAASDGAGASAARKAPTTALSNRCAFNRIGDALLIRVSSRTASEVGIVDRVRPIRDPFPNGPYCHMDP